MDDHLPEDTYEGQNGSFRTIVENVSRTMDLPTSVWVPDETGQTLRIEASVGLPASFTRDAFLALDEPSVTGAAFKSGEVTIARDVLSDPRWKYKDEAREMGWKSVLCVPIRVHGAIIGVISIYTFVTRDFSDIEKELLTNYASQIELTVEADRWRKTLDRLLEIGRDIEQRIAERPGAVLEEIVKGACEVSGADCAVLYPYDVRRQDFYDVESVAAHGLSKPLRLSERPRTQTGMAAYVGRVGEIVVPDIKEQDSEMLASPFISREGIKAFMGIALQAAGDVLGVLYVDYRTPHQFSEEEKDNIRLFAHQAAIAIYNSRLYQDAMTRAEALKRLHEVGPTLVSITGAESLQAVLTQIVRGAQSVLGANLVDVYQYVQSRDEFILPPIQVGERYEPSVRKDEIYEDDAVAAVVRHRQPQYILTSQQTPDLTQPFTVERPDIPSTRFVVREHIKSTAAVPLIVGTELVGVLFANYRSPQTFPPQQRELTELFASQAAAAIRTARLFEQRRSLQDMARDITCILDKNELLQGILERSLKLLGCEAGSIALLNRATNQLEYKYAIGKETDWGVPFGKGLIGTAAETGKPVRVGDVTKDTRYIDHVPETRSELDVPMLIGDELVGVLNAESTQLDAFDEDDEALAVVLANQAAVALHNADLFQQTQERLERLQVLNEISKLLMEERDVSETIKLLLQRALSLFKVDHGSFWSIDYARQCIDLQFSVDQYGRMTEWYQKEIKRSVPLASDTSIVGNTAVTRNPNRWNDVSECPYWDDRHDRETGYRTKRMLSVPLLVQIDVPQEISPIDSSSSPKRIGLQRAIGVIQILNPTDDADFSEEDEDFLMSIAALAAIALYSAEMRQREVTLNEVGRTLTVGSRLHEPQILELVYEQAGKLMDTDNMYIALYDSLTDTVRFGLAFVNGRRVDVVKEAGWQPRQAGKGKTEEIIHTKKPIFHATKAEAEAWYAQREHQEYVGAVMGSWLGVPMMVGERMLGVIATYHPTQDYVYGEDDREILQAMANQAAIALDNAHLFYDINQRVRALVEFGQAVTSGILLSEGEVLELIYEQASQLMDTDNMYIAFYDESTDTVRFGLAFVNGRRVDVVKEAGWQPRQAGKGKTEEIIHTKKPIFHATKAEAEAWYAQREHQEYIGDPLASWLGVPMMVGERMLGVIAMYHPMLDYVYSGNDLEILQAMAHQAAIALDNARLYEETLRLQNEVIAAQQLATLGTAIAALQHRINNTFNIIVPNVTRLRKRVDMKDTTIVEILDIIERNARYTSDIITRIQEPLREIEDQDVNINAVLNDVVGTVREHRPPDPKVEVALELDDAVPQIQASIGQIAEVFRNLVDNAYRAMKEGGQLTITSQCTDGTIRVSVRDTGCGIPPGVQQRLFEKPVPSREPGGGAGLGLWLSRLMLQRIGGDITLAGSDPTGTTMLVRIPTPETGRKVQP